MKMAKFVCLAMVVFLAAAIYFCFNPHMLSGQVFIVTEGRENVKMGGVEVFLIERKHVAVFLNVKYAKQRAAQLSELQTKISAVQTEVLRLTGMPLWITNASQHIEANVAAEHQLQNDYPNVAEALVPKISEITALANSVNGSLTDSVNLSQTPGNYLSDLLSTVPVTYQAVTDADGRFSIPCPRIGAFTLYATAQRKVPSEYGTYTENYYWLVDAPAGTDNAQLFLNNRNLWHPPMVTAEP
jgi:hypothetical protein